MTELSRRKRMALARAHAFRAGRGNDPYIKMIGEQLSRARGMAWARQHREKYGPMTHENSAWFSRVLAGTLQPGDTEKTGPGTLAGSMTHDDTCPELAKRDV